MSLVYKHGCLPVLPGKTSEIKKMKNGCVVARDNYIYENWRR
jgi:hypothetical protein